MKKLAVRLRKPSTVEQADELGEAYLELRRQKTEAEARYAPVIAACERALKAATKARDKEVGGLTKKEEKAKHLLKEFGLDNEADLLRGNRVKQFLLPLSQVLLRFKRKPPVDLALDEDEKVIIKRIRVAGHEDTLLRADWRLHLTNIKDPKNRALVDSIRGMRLIDLEGNDVFIEP